MIIRARKCVYTIILIILAVCRVADASEDFTIGKEPIVIAQGINVRTYEGKKPGSATAKKTPAKKTAATSTGTLDIVIGGETNNEPVSTAGSTGKVSAVEQKLNESLEAAEAEAREGTGAQAALATLKAVTIRTLKGDMANFAEASKGLLTVDSIYPGSFPTKESLDKRLAEFRNLRTQNSALITSLKSLPNRFLSELASFNVTPEEAQASAGSALQFLAIPAKQAYHEACDLLCTEAMVVLETLSKQWGKWMFDEQKQQLGYKPEFNDDERKKLEAANSAFQLSLKQMQSVLESNVKKSE